MAETPEMPAAELMAKADYELDGPPMSWERFKELYPESTRRRIHGKRAAVRVLAACQDSWPKAINDACVDALEYYEECGGTSNDIPVAFLLAVAEEGETK